METPPILNFEQISEATHACEVLPYGLVLITDKQNGNTFLLCPMYPPRYIAPEDLEYVRKFYSDNRAFTPEETKLLQAIVMSPDQALLAENSAAVLKWYTEVEKYVGPIPTKPTEEALKNPLYWNFCPVEVELKTGEVYSCALVSYCAPWAAELNHQLKHILLKEVVEIRVSPFAVPKEVLAAAEKEGVGSHMGESGYAAEAGGKYWSLLADNGFTFNGMFFKSGVVKGSDLHVSPVKVTESLLREASPSEPIECVIVDGLW